MRTFMLAASACAVVLAAGCSSTSSGTAATSSPAAKSGTEVLAGTSTSTANNAPIPLTATGVVHATGGKLPSGGANKGTDTIPFTQGSLTVYHARTAGTQHFDKAACAFSGNETGTYTVQSGTGVFKGATGHGTYKVTFEGKFKLTGGKCKVSNSTEPASAQTTFHASGPLRVP